jgi:hypothetical protein
VPARRDPEARERDDDYDERCEGEVHGPRR